MKQQFVLLRGQIVCKLPFPEDPNIDFSFICTMFGPSNDPQCRRAACLHATLCVCASVHLLNPIYGKRPLCSLSVRAPHPLPFSSHRLFALGCVGSDLLAAAARGLLLWCDSDDKDGGCVKQISVHLLCGKTNPLISSSSFYSFISCSPHPLPWITGGRAAQSYGKH